MIVALLLTLTLAVGADPTSEPGSRSAKPEPLRRALDARAPNAFRTAEIELVVRETTSDGVRNRLLTWRSAGDDYILVDHGDEHAVVMRDEKGKPASYDYNTPRHLLVKPGEVWLHHERCPTAVVLPVSSHNRDWLYHPRKLGMSPFVDGDLFDDRMAAASLGDVVYSARESGGEWEVSARAADVVCRWWIDPGRGWSIVRAVAYQNDVALLEMRAVVDRQGESWFPKRVEYTRLLSGPEPWIQITVQSARFNDARHKARFDPGDIGIEVGTVIEFMNRPPGPQHVWDGAQAIPSEAFAARVRSGGLVRGPVIGREFERMKLRRDGSGRSAPPPTPTSRPALDGRAQSPGEWEKYTEEFVRQYGLVAGQRERAYAILKDCVESANSHSARRREDFEEYERKLAAASGRADEVARVQASHASLLQPFATIFNNGLVPRLDKLLTAEQRANRPTSAPAGATPAAP